MKSIVRRKEYPRQDTFQFQLSHTDHSIANSIRRTILADIPTVVADISKCVVHKNTTRLNSEVLKQRLGQIPVHIVDKAKQQYACDNYELVIHTKNESSATAVITTDDFRIRDISNTSSENTDDTSFIPKENVNNIFPHDPITRMPIDFGRMRGKIATCTPVEELHMTCRFKLSTASVDGGYAVASTATYQNTVDDAAADLAEQKYVQTERESNRESMTETELEEYIAYKTADFRLLERKRVCKPNCFDFRVVTVGVYEPSAIVVMACRILVARMRDWLSQIMDNTISIRVLPDLFYEFVIPGDTHTLSHAVAYALYSQFFEGPTKSERILSYCAVKQAHPHDKNATLLIATHLTSTPDDVRAMIQTATTGLIDNYIKIANDLEK